MANTENTENTSLCSCGHVIQFPNIMCQFCIVKGRISDEYVRKRILFVRNLEKIGCSHEQSLMIAAHWFPKIRKRKCLLCDEESIHPKYVCDTCLYRDKKCAKCRTIISYNRVLCDECLYGDKKCLYCT